ncbi:hypothetical protein SD421_05105 [Qipengyuania sp. HL-TH1]|jgi:hypothetical protein|uniref:hypothetical protein n=1 Tax=Qipengyuania profunda TaxID=3113984 RepID=UPI002A18BBF6|nr:hypothetical protein [Qipengyuania sp. HL-TH1]WPL57810.1 hypothetical protein SD421_05105 [Qipengyuania sp. HL-TH5]
MTHRVIDFRFHQGRAKTHSSRFDPPLLAQPSRFALFLPKFETSGPVQRSYLEAAAGNRRL